MANNKSISSRWLKITLPLQKHFLTFTRNIIYFNKHTCPEKIGFTILQQLLICKESMMVGGRCCGDADKGPSFFTWPHDQKVTWLDRWGLPTQRHHPTIFSGYIYCRSIDTCFLIHCVTMWPKYYLKWSIGSF